MILIGSRAAKEWFQDFREPNDYDLIASAGEVDNFRAKHAIKREMTKGSHVFMRLENGAKWQFELPTPGNESALLVRGVKTTTVNNLLIEVASPSTLLAIKASHVNRPLKRRFWEKHIDDYHFLKNRVQFREEDRALLELRKSEVEKRLKVKRPYLNMTNEDFFEGSEYLVNRKYVHDDLHEVVKFGEKPLYMSLKEDQSRAMCYERLFDKLSKENKLNLVREEAFVIALERKVIPHGRDAFNAFKWAMYRICTTLTSGWFREFATENYFDIIKTNLDYVEKFRKAEPTIRKM